MLKSCSGVMASVRRARSTRCPYSSRNAKRIHSSADERMIWEPNRGSPVVEKHQSSAANIINTCGGRVEPCIGVRPRPFSTHLGVTQLHRAGFTLLFELLKSINPSCVE